MIYKYSAYNSERYATDLKRDKATQNLTWEIARGQDVLIVQTPFGSRAIDYIEEICHLLPKASLVPGKYTEILAGVWIRFVTAADRSRNGGCRLNGEASTYTVFSYYIENDVCEIYQPHNQAVLDIPLEVHVDITKEIRTEGVLRKREIDTGFWSVSFPRAYGNSYIDGDLAYKIGDFEIPITRQMVKQNKFYIYSSICPKIISYNKGLHIV